MVAIINIHFGDDMALALAFALVKIEGLATHTRTPLLTMPANKELKGVIPCWIIYPMCGAASRFQLTCPC